MSEKASYNTLRKNVVGHGDRMNRIENPIVPGMFDVNGCLRPGVEFWLEIKTPTTPKRVRTPLFGSNHRVSQEQINWGISQTQAGGNAYIYIDADKHRILFNCASGLFESINKMTLEELWEAAAWHAIKPTGFETWQTLRNTLLKPHLSPAGFIRRTHR